MHGVYRRHGTIGLGADGHRQWIDIHMVVGHSQFAGSLYHLVNDRHTFPGCFRDALVVHRQRDNLAAVFGHNGQNIHQSLWLPTDGVNHGSLVYSFDSLVQRIGVGTVQTQWHIGYGLHILDQPNQVFSFLFGMRSGIYVQPGSPGFSLSRCQVTNGRGIALFDSGCY